VEVARPSRPATRSTISAGAPKPPWLPGYRAYRVDASVGGAIPDNVFNQRERVHLVAQACKAAREGVGPRVT